MLSRLLQKPYLCEAGGSLGFEGRAGLPKTAATLSTGTGWYQLLCPPTCSLLCHPIMFMVPVDISKQKQITIILSIFQRPLYPSGTRPTPRCHFPGHGSLGTLGTHGAPVELSPRTSGVLLEALCVWAALWGWGDLVAGIFCIRLA